MAKCELCKKEMLEADSCNEIDIKYPNGKTLKQIPYDGDKRCHDCNVISGGFHHPGCDMEQCPKCGGQLISCGCLDK